MSKKRRLHLLEIAAKNASFDILGYIRKKFKEALNKKKGTMIENHKFKIGDHVIHRATGTHTVWEISGYGENGYRVKEHLDSVRILYEKEDEWELYDSDKYQSLINN